MDLVVPYEDEHLLVVDKPAGLVVHPAPGHARGTLVHGLLALRRRRRRRARAARHRAPPRPRHVRPARRRPLAGGAPARCRSSCRRARLTRRVHARSSSAGRARARGTIDAPIGRDRSDAQRHSLDTDTPRDAVTHFEVEELLPRHALLRVHARDGAHASDPRASRRDRPAGRRRLLVWSPRRARARAPVPARGAACVRASDHRRDDRRVLAASRPSSRRAWSEAS